MVPLQEGERDSIRIEPRGTAEVDLPDLEGPVDLRVWDRERNIIGEPLRNAVVGPNPATGSLPRAGDKTIHLYGFPNQSARVLILESSTGKAFQVEDGTGKSDFTFDENGRTSVSLLVSAAPEASATERALSPSDVLITTLKFGSDNFGEPSVFAIPSQRVGDLSVGAMLKGLSSVSAAGVRPTARFANTLKANPPVGSLSKDILANAFEPVAGLEDVSFLYSIDIVSSGRELQNKPIHNIAGLGIANGDRPFRPFARPVAFEPRSQVRIQIEELSTLPGTLYIVLQGYKTLGTGRRPD